MRTAFLTLSFSLFAALGVPASDPVSVKVTPLFGFAPLTARARIHIDHDSRNRAACLIADDEVDYLSDCWQLDGVDAPITYWKEFRDLPVGEYQVVVLVEQTMNRSMRSIAVPLRSLGRE